MKRQFSAIFGIPFLGGGLAMLFMLWGNDSNFPPLPMKLFGSFVCIPVAAAGGFIIYSAFFGKDHSVKAPQNTSNTSQKTAVNNDRLNCYQCGAAVGKDTEISPSGDVKCEYCDSWFNVRASS